MSNQKIVISPENPKGILVDLTAEEISEQETNATKDATRVANEATAKTEKENAQASGNKKLLDLGLTQAEATALTGYSIPVVSEEDPE